VDLSAISGLRNLKALRYFSAELDTSWCLLPNLRWLEVGQACWRPDLLQGYASSLTPSARSNVSALEMSIPSSLTISKVFDEVNSTRSCFLSSRTFPVRICLTLQLTNIRFRGYEQDDFNGVLYDKPIHGKCLTKPYDASFDILLDQLEGVSSTLSVLTVDTYTDLDRDFLGFIAPTISMHKFKSLKILAVPQELLLGQDYGTPGQIHVQPSPHRLLPPTLERLDIMCPCLHIFDWLDEVLDDDDLKFLEVVNIDCGYYRSELCPVISDMAEIWGEDRQVWFKLIISHPTDGDYHDWCRH
jgi:hypothetical protein